ncbi:MAG: hypothetical protein FGM37_04550, partial [Phycisphaerales bacterium]|nr:hypothetical protein [Phycisphaerales bacterium]
MATADATPLSDAPPTAMPRWPLLAVFGGAVASVMSAVAPAAARQTVAIAGRSGTDSASAAIADGAAASIALASSLVVLAGATAVAIHVRRRFVGAGRRCGAMILAGALAWAVFAAASAGIQFAGVPTSLPVTSDGASLALSAMTILGAALMAHGIRPAIRALGMQSGITRESSAACGAMETAIVAAAAVTGCRLFVLTLPAVGWTPLVPVV